MRFGLIDLLFPLACELIGIAIGTSLLSHGPRSVRQVAGIGLGLGLYAASIYPFYRGLKLYPMILPRCPCCGRRTDGFWIFSVWPRIGFQCPACDGEFAVWLNGTPGDQETWENPVLVLKWPYAFGIYKRAKKPESGAA